MSTLMTLKSKADIQSFKASLGDMLEQINSVPDAETLNISVPESDDVFIAPLNPSGGISGKFVPQIVGGWPDLNGDGVPDNIPAPMIPYVRVIMSLQTQNAHLASELLEASISRSRLDRFEHSLLSNDVQFNIQSLSKNNL